MRQCCWFCWLPASGNQHCSMWPWSLAVRELVCECPVRGDIQPQGCNCSVVWRKAYKTWQNLKAPDKITKPQKHETKQKIIKKPHKPYVAHTVQDGSTVVQHHLRGWVFYSGGVLVKFGVQEFLFFFPSFCHLCHPHRGAVFKYSTERTAFRGLRFHKLTSAMPVLKRHYICFFFFVLWMSVCLSVGTSSGWTSHLAVTGTNTWAHSAWTQVDSHLSGVVTGAAEHWPPITDAGCVQRLKREVGRHCISAWCSPMLIQVKFTCAVTDC